MPKKTAAKSVEETGDGEDKRATKINYEDFVAAASSTTVYYAEFELIGTAPLLMNKRGPLGTPRYAYEPRQARDMRRIENALAIQEAIDKAKRGEIDIDSALEKKAYRNDDNVLCVQSLAVRLCLISAVTGVVWSGQYNLPNILRRSVRGSQEYFPLYTEDESGSLAPCVRFNPRWDAGRNPNTQQKKGVDIWRPEIPLPWYMPCRFRVDLFPLNMDPAPILYALTLGGERIGLGDWRQEKDGPMGTFRVAHFRIVSEEEPIPTAPPLDSFPGFNR